MSRLFVRATTDYVDLAAGAIGAVDGGPCTIAALWKPASLTTGQLAITANGSGYEVFGLAAVSDGQIYATIGGAYTAMQSWAASDGWRIDVWSKPSGAAQTVRGHTVKLSSGTWSHANYGTLNDTTNVPVASTRVGYGLGSNPFDGQIAAVMIAATTWTDEQIETLLSGGLAGWKALADATTAALWAFNQATTTDPVLDLTSGDADQTAISGTSVSADDPPGWSYSLAEPVSVSAAGTLPALTSAGVVTVAPTAVAAAGALPALTSAAAVGVTPPGVTAAGTLPALTSAAVVSVANPPTLLIPNSELVAVAWLAGAAGLSSSMVSTRLPRDTSAWAADGFLTVGDGTGRAGGVVGGTRDPHTRLRSPVISLHAWAVNPSSGKPPFGKAAQLLETVGLACDDESTIRRALSFPPRYASARVNEAYFLGEPKRIPGDEASYAHFQVDLQLHWVVLS